METYDRQLEEESLTSKLMNTAKNKPFFVAAVASLMSVCGYGAYKWRTRTIPVQMFLIQLRVAAQGTAVGVLSVGMIYHMCKDMFFDEKKPEEE